MIKSSQLSKHIQAAISAAVPKKPVNKYGAQKTKVDEITFDSKAEALRYQLNKIRIAQGQLQYQLLQVPIRLPGGVKYVVDFIEVMPDGAFVYVDVKGKVTRPFRDKKKMVESLYPIEIVCVKCTHYDRMQFQEFQI